MAPRERPDRPVDPGAGRLTAEELLAVVRVHLDRVHDAVRRTGGQDGPDAVEVVRRSALALVDEVAERSLDAERAVGAWFRRALDLAARRPAGPPAEGSRELDGALDTLTPDARRAVLLRDAYDLPLAAVATALGTDEQDALTRVARARLAVPAAGAPSDVPERADRDDPPDVLDADPPTWSGGAGHADLATLARLAEDRPVSPADATARRHVLSCTACGGSLQGQTRAARVVAGLVVVGLAGHDRAALLTEVEQRARERLQTSGSSSRRAERLEETTGPFVLPASDGDAPVEDGPPDVGEQPRRLLSPLLVVLSVVLAALAGVGAGLLLDSREQSQRRAASQGQLVGDVRLITPQPSPPTTLPSPPTVQQQRPRTTVVVVPPSPLPPPSPSPTPSPTPTTPVAPAVALQPTSGPAGTELTVTGSGFPAGADVRLVLLDPAGEPTGAAADAAADATGALTATLTADPAAQAGEHVVLATAGELTARATFTVEAP